MSNRLTIEGDNAPIANKAELIAHLAGGAKAQAQWRIGTEHEKFAYRRSDFSAPAYEGTDGIGAILDALTRYGWRPVVENDRVIALTQEGASVSLEPGGQLELSGAPFQTIHQTCDEVGTHLTQVKAIGDELGLGFLGIGLIPHLRRQDMPMMPKGRYAIMKRYMPKVGSLGLDMMFRTATIQVNLDFSDEADMVKKFRVGLALQPVATALFANSPFLEGKPNGYLSYRSHIWTDTDKARTGILPFVFEDGMSFERYVDYALDVPMYFVYRDNQYIDVAGQSFRDFMNGKLPGLPGEKPSLADWKDHLSTIFPEVRLKTYLEMRGADGGPWSRICALSAFWVGLMYHQSALDAAWDLVKDFSLDDHQSLRDEVPRRALKAAAPRYGNVQALALEVLSIADAGLKARAQFSSSGENEQGFLAELWEIAKSGKSPAQRLLDAYAGPWQKNIHPLFEEQSY